MYINPNTVNVGDKLEIQITGMVGNYEALVVGWDHGRHEGPTLKVTDDPMWKDVLLKMGDYIIVGRNQS